VRGWAAIVISTVALAVALAGTTPGTAASHAVRLALFAGNAGAVNGIKASRSPEHGKLVPLGRNGRFPKQVIPAVDAASVAGIRASILPKPSQLLTLGPDGYLPSSTIPPEALNPPVVYGTLARSTNQTIPTQVVGGPVSRIAFDAAPDQVGGVFVNPSHPTDLIVPQDGLYLITAYLVWTPGDPVNGGNNRNLAIFVNDHQIVADQRPPAYQTHQTLAVIFRLRTGDAVSEGLGHDNATPLDVYPGASLSVYRLAPLGLIN
jgi:hypothetical protein